VVLIVSLIQLQSTLRLCLAFLQVQPGLTSVIVTARQRSTTTYLITCTIRQTMPIEDLFTTNSTEVLQGCKKLLFFCKKAKPGGFLGFCFFKKFLQKGTTVRMAHWSGQAGLLLTLHYYQLIVVCSEHNLKTVTELSIMNLLLYTCKLQLLHFTK